MTDLDLNDWRTWMGGVKHIRTPGGTDVSVRLTDVDERDPVISLLAQADKLDQLANEARKSADDAERLAVKVRELGFAMLVTDKEETE